VPVTRATVLLLSLLAPSLACGPAVDDGDDETGAGTGATSPASMGPSDDETALPAGSTGEPASCEGLDEDACASLSQCQTVKGAEAQPEGGPGEYSCSDISLPFACAPVGCEPSPTVVVICSLDEPGRAMWIVDGECVPPGWEPCPDGVCA
jgi:hypothetical protein